MTQYQRLAVNAKSVGQTRRKPAAALPTGHVANFYEGRTATRGKITGLASLSLAAADQQAATGKRQQVRERDALQARLRERNTVLQDAGFVQQVQGSRDIGIHRSRGVGCQDRGAGYAA